MAVERKSDVIPVRVPPSLGEWIREDAEKEGQRLSEWFRELAKRERGRQTRKAA